LVCSIFAIACTLVVVDRSALVAHPRESQVMWTTDVEAIVRTRCVGCHVAGGFAPMSLATYEEAREWGSAIAEEVLERRMPPWSAAPGFADYANDRSLSATEIEMLASWGMGGTPLGPAVERAAPPPAVAKRTPDLVLQSASERVSTPIRRVELPTNFAKDRSVTGWQFVPGNPAIVSQAVVSLGPGRVLGTWTPPEGPTFYPAGVAVPLQAGARVSLEIHYRRSARVQSDSSGVALYFGDGAARQRVLQSFPCGTTTLDRAVDVLALTPRAAAAQASLEVLAARPDGSIEPLSVIPSYHPQYPTMYRFRSSINLPRNSRIEVRSSLPHCSADLEIVPATRGD
jgi:hypothetical protein